MISDDERREVVKRLRNGGVAMDPEEAYTLLLWCVGIMPQLPATSTYDDSMVRLADLIDRPTCHDVADFDRESFKCSRCGYRVLSIDGAPDAAKLVGTKGGVIDFGFCPNCGATVTEGGGCDVSEL